MLVFSTVIELLIHPFPQSSSLSLPYLSRTQVPCRASHLGTSNKLVSTIHSDRLAVQVLVRNSEENSSGHVLVFSGTLGGSLVLVLFLLDAASKSAIYSFKL